MFSLRDLIYRERGTKGGTIIFFTLVYLNFFLTTVNPLKLILPSPTTHTQTHKHRPFLLMVHPLERAGLASILNRCTTLSEPYHGRLRRRFWWANNLEYFKELDFTVNIGTYGLVCSLWEVNDPSPKKSTK